MTITWGKPVSGQILFGAFVLVCLCWFFYPPNTRLSGGFDTETVTGPSYESPLDASLPHYRYRQIEDSLRDVKYKNDFFTGASGGGWQFNFDCLGIASYELPQGKTYLLSLKGYRLEDFVSVDNLKSGTIVSYPVWDKIENNNRSGHTETVQTPVKYREGKKDWEGTVYLPVAKTTGIVLWLVFMALVVTAGVFALYAVLYVPARFLWQLSKGKAFTEENIGSLYLTGWVLVAYSLFMAGVNIITHLVVASQMPQGIEFSFYAAFMKTTPSLLAGLAVLLLAKAFLQGLELKEEQDLTV